jgi:predicted enzyme related to lactoylglutathione lyase
MCRLRGSDVAAIGSPPPAGAPPGWTTYVWVDDADAVAASAVKAGGSLLAEPFGSLDGGRMAIVADPAGAAFGVWTPGAHRGAQRINEPSAYAMSFLRTPDPEGAKVFYGAVLGWTTEAFGSMLLWRLSGYVGGVPEQPVSRDVVAVMARAGDGEAAHTGGPTSGSPTPTQPPRARPSSAARSSPAPRTPARSARRCSLTRRARPSR